MAQRNKKKKYEPPVVKEIGGVFQQAMGVSQCVTGPTFTTGTCTVGRSASTGCAQGNRDQACNTGASDTNDCTMGFSAGGACTNGPSRG
jgi:hypothetical protein